MEEFLARINETAPTGSFVTQRAARDADTNTDCLAPANIYQMSVIKK